MKLLLFDIDGTLLASGGAGARALARAFQELHGVGEAMREVAFAGRTDPLIVRAIFETRVGRPPANAEVDAILERYLTHLPGEMQRPDGARTMPGVETLLEDLARRPGVLMGLLTGNVERGARIKLGRFELNRYFEFGGFASDATERSEIARVARARGGERAGLPLGPDDVVVIGDTPLDIAAGKAIAATTLAVATGPHAAQDLASHAPDILLADFGDTARTVSLMLGWERRA